MGTIEAAVGLKGPSQDWNFGDVYLLELGETENEWLGRCSVAVWAGRESEKG